MTSFLLALDQGTSSSRALLYDQEGRVHASAQVDFDAQFPAAGWVEQDPEVLWQTSLRVCREVLDQRPPGGRVVAMGITNQRETSILWDRRTGEPVYPAIVWQDRRTTERCEAMRAEGVESWLQARTGLLIDPYFSGTKIAWLLDQVPHGRERANRGELAVGTVDAFLIWRLSNGRYHRTDATNASRTQLMALQGGWDAELLRYFRVPRALLPEITDSAGDIAEVDRQWFGESMPITGVAGDQQAALIGQACFTEGSSKATYGTGCFLMLHTGLNPRPSKHRLLTTVAYQVQGQRQYALEGSIFVAGAAIKWLRDRLQIIGNAAATENIAAAQTSSRGVYVVPAFAGLGAPYWDAQARGVITGLTLDSTREDIVRATLDAVAFQTADLLRAAQQDGAVIQSLRVDGGMVVNNWLCQNLADVLACPVERPKNTETTAAGAAMLAAVGAGLQSDLSAMARWWAQDRVFQPGWPQAERELRLAGWSAAVQRARSAS